MSTFNRKAETWQLVGALHKLHKQFKNMTEKFGCGSTFKKRGELMKMLPHVSKLRHIYNVFETDSRGRIHRSVIAECLRGMELNLSLPMLKASIAKVMCGRDKQPPSRISFEMVLAIYCVLSKHIKRHSHSAEEFIQGLRAYDTNGTGKLPYGQMRRMLTTVGDPLTGREADTLLKSAKDDEGNVDYERLVYVLTNQENQIAEIAKQAHMYLVALGRNALYFDMQERDDFIDMLRNADPQNTGLITIERLRKLLNRGTDKFSISDLRLLTANVTNVGGQIDYREFLRVTMDE